MGFWLLVSGFWLSNCEITSNPKPCNQKPCTLHTLKHFNGGDSERTRTSNLLIRSQMLYPLSYGAIFRGAKIERDGLKNQAVF